MPFTLNPELGAKLGELMGGQPPPEFAVGDIKSRQEMMTGLYGILGQAIPDTEGVSSKDFHTKAEDGHDIALRWYTKDGSKGPGSAILYAHGGGYIGLNLDSYDTVMKRYVNKTGVPMLSVDYRLSPEVKAPVHVTDTYAGLKYLIANADSLGVDPTRIGIMGDSAGGGIAASLAHYIKLKGGPAVKKQILVYPMLDDRNVELDENIAPYATWSIDDNKTAWAAVLGEKVGKEGVDPIEAAGRMTVKDARGLPPAYIDVGELDNFRDENLEYAQTLGKAGVECEFHLFPGVNHAFQDIVPNAAVSLQALEARYTAMKSI